jgi:hypothetical protein
MTQSHKNLTAFGLDDLKVKLPLLGGEGVWQELKFLSRWERCTDYGCARPKAVRVAPPIKLTS